MSIAVPTVSPRKASEIAEDNTSAILLDVRTPSEFSARHAVGAWNIPLDTIPSTIAGGNLP
jgi:rhodanese-related sulfurtransferase